MGYHIRNIKKGIYGNSSKIIEEIEEFLDAEEQNAHIMVLNELSDIIGAIKGYLSKNYPTIKLDDLIKMSDLTESAFIDGDRK